MSVITISRASCSYGQEIAEDVARRLGFSCISREVLIEASDVFNVAEINLAKAVHDGPSFFERITSGKEKYISYIRATLLNHIRRDNIVYHGLAGHFFLQGISHVLKVRLIADFEKRTEKEMQLTGASRSMAIKRLQKDDEERKKWSMAVYGKDSSDPEMYDLVLNTRHVSMDDCINIICSTVKQPAFKTTPESAKKLNNMAMEANVKALLVSSYPDAGVDASDGTIKISLLKKVTDRRRTVTNIKRLLQGLSGIKELEIKVDEEVTPRSLMYMVNRR